MIMLKARMPLMNMNGTVKVEGKSTQLLVADAKEQLIAS
jgi:hypothetical protein